jgi:tripartite-type tricarboxylate transporter receptor subunit TctC
MVGQGPLVVAVSGQDSYASIADILAAAKREPGKLNYGSSGIGSLAHLATTLLNDAAKVDIAHVPYKGAAAAAGDLAGGRIQLMIANYSSLAPLLDGNKVRLIATTSPEPHEAFPGLQPVAKDVPGYDVDIWVGIFAPAGTPRDLIERYNKAFNEINRSPRLEALLKLDGTTPAALTPEQFAQRVEQDLQRWKKVATEHGIEVN